MMRLLNKVNLFFVLCFFTALNPAFGKEPDRAIAISLKANRQLYGLNDSVRVSVKIKNTSLEKLELETLPSFTISSMTTFAFWVPVGLKQADVGFDTGLSSNLKLKPGEEKSFKYDLSALKWNELHSILKTPLRLNFLVSPGEYRLSFSLAIIKRPSPKTIEVLKTFDSNYAPIIFEGQAQDFSGIKGYLTGLTDKEIEEYFKDCVAKNRVFIYTGGPGNAPLLNLPRETHAAIEEFLITNKVHTISVGCTGGAKEAYKFNKLMLDYLIRKLEQKN